MNSGKLRNDIRIRKTAAVTLGCLIGILVITDGFSVAATKRPPASSTFDPPSAATSDQEKIVERVNQLVNEFRKEQGLAPLVVSPFISAEARQHSIDMSRDGRISHNGFKQRVGKIQQKIPYRSAGENVAVNLGYKDPARAAVAGWKKSPDHRKNMLGNFSLTGIGIARGKNGSYFFTQIFIEPLNRAA
jgi:uncharacterized protein YkwD